MAAYESEITGFLRSLKQANPEIENRQREGRALWWDRPHDPDELRRWQEARVQASPYQYYPFAPVKPAAGS